ncbi:MAG: hypothetical protein GJ680_19285 [Alteromonadaceae bacterium]|nr:hypothetical protein [Alteromonadaceae bacterium]
MAKSKLKRLKKTKSATDVVEIKRSGTINTLANYSRYEDFSALDTSDRVRIWFEPNYETRSKYKGRNIRLLKGKHSRKHMVTDKRNMPIAFQKEVARAFVAWAQSKVVNVNSLNTSYDDTVAFMDYLSETHNVKSMSDIDRSIWLNFLDKTNKSHARVRAVFVAHPLVNIEIFAPKLRTQSNSPSKDIKPEDLFVDDTYSDKEQMQILGFTLYHIEWIQNRLADFNKVDRWKLADRGELIPVEEVSNWDAIKNGSVLYKICASYDKEPERALEILLQNIMSRTKESILFHKSTPITIKNSSFSRTVLKKIKDAHKLFYDAFICYFNNLYLRPEGEQGSFENTILLKRGAVHESVLGLYVLFQTGVNKEVLDSCKKQYGEQNWKERYDINLGVDSNTVLKRKVLRITGIKNKGAAGKKPIDIRVPVDSQLYKILCLWESNFSKENSDLFSTGKLSPSGLRRFCEIYPIFTDNGSRLETISTKKIRKMFAGVELAKAIESAGSSEELVRRLREALNHESFDTTVFSYLMKTGVGHFVYSNAVIALTTKMLEEALQFQGQIKTKKERGLQSNIPVYLCDCENPFTPTHDVPIADRCRHYDLCLGCERSVVHAEHISRICYRVLQYDNTPSPADEIIADRKSIALDCIERFRNEHPDGDVLVDHGFQLARDAMLNDRPLLPPIL